MSSESLDKHSQGRQRLKRMMLRRPSCATCATCWTWILFLMQSILLFSMCTYILTNKKARILAMKELPPEVFLRGGISSPHVYESNYADLGTSRSIFDSNDSVHPANQSDETKLPSTKLVWKERIIEPQYQQRGEVKITKGNSISNDSNQGLFLVVSDTRAGADMMLRKLDGYGLCASTKAGDYPTAALMPNTMPWFDDSSTEKGCTFAFVRDSLLNVLLNKNSGSSNNIPNQCQADYDSSNDPLKNHLPRFCRFLGDLHNDTSVENMARLFVSAFHNDDKNVYTGCHCGKNTHHKGLKAMVEWLDQVPLHQTAFRGSKMIRLTRRNLFERYLSLVLSYQTGVYHVQEISDKQAQVEKFRNLNFSIDVNEMLSYFERFQSDDAKGGKWTRENAGEILHIDYEDIRNQPEESFQKILDFLGVKEHANIDAKGILDFQQYRAANMLEHIRNRDQVEEALGANGYGHFIGRPAAHEIQQLVYNADASFRHANEIPGIRTIVLDGITSKTSTIEVLQQIPPDRLVIIADGQRATRNPHVRDMGLWYQELGSLRANLSGLQDRVIISASSSIPNSLSHSPPGSLFDESRRRTNRACSTDCETFGKSDNVELWKKFLHQEMQQKGQETLFPDGTYIAGTAAALSTFLIDLQIRQDEDEKAVISDYMYRNKEKIVLDSSQDVFGTSFYGVEWRMENCNTKKDDLKFTTSSHPLLLQHSEPSYCAEIVRDRYPKWDGDSIAIDPILEHVDNLLLRNVSLNGVHPFDREILYVFDKNGIWSSRVIPDIYRAKPTEEFLSIVHDELLQSAKLDESRWKGLQRVMNLEVGFPYFAYYGDWKSCNTNNAGADKSVPMQTTCAERDCKHSFPSPTYQSIMDRQEDTRHWFEQFSNWNKDFPWESKQRQIIWRGGLTENDSDKVFDSQRWRFTKLIHELPDQEKKALFDVGLTYVPDFLPHYSKVDVSLVGGLKQNNGGMANFQKYLAILDADGNSWSSRFGTLLCFNSVVVKIEPEYLDYFYHDLTPWKHFVPVKDDLSDLVENVSFILDPANDALAREIVANANQWCSERYTTKELAYDMLDIYESYVQMLDHADPDWTTKWERKKRELFNNSSAYHMLKIK